MVIVTGASKGIGKAIAEQFGKQGLDLVICSRNADLVARQAKELAELYGVKVWGYAADLSKKQDVLELADKILALNEPIDALINNAGVFLGGGIQTEPDGTLEASLDLNVKGVYYLTRQLVPKLISQQSGLIVNIASTASFMPFWNCLSYTMSKHALLGFSKCLRQELKGQGIKVTTLMPGGTLSAAWDGSGVDEHRLMKPEDVAQAVWLAFSLPPNAVLEELVMRPQLGDL